MRSLIACFRQRRTDFQICSTAGDHQVLFMSSRPMPSDLTAFLTSLVILPPQQVLFQHVQCAWWDVMGKATISVPAATIRPAAVHPLPITSACTVQNVPKAALPKMTRNMKVTIG